jgi:integrase
LGTGLRFGEALRLRVADVDLAQRRFVVRESKGKTRLVPFRADLAHVLRRYLVARRPIADITAEDRLLLQPSGRPYRTGTASDLVRRLLRRAGLKPSTGRVGPRPYDMRHTFAVHRLTRWYRAGVDLHARLPLLAVYLGHESLLGTEVYLTATPALLALAGKRFAARVFAPRRSR